MRIILIALTVALVVGCATLGIYDARAPYKARLSACLKTSHSALQELDCKQASWLECRANGLELDCGETLQ